MGSVKRFNTASLTSLQAAERALNSGGHLSGITTGIGSVNAKIGGMHNSDLMILAGRPGMGKTSLATNIAYNAAERFRRDEEDGIPPEKNMRSEEHTSELQSLMRISYAVFCLTKKQQHNKAH